MHAVAGGMALAVVFVSACVFVQGRGVGVALLYVHTRFMVNKRLFLSAKASPVLLRGLVVVLPQQFGR